MEHRFVSGIVAPPFCDGEEKTEILGGFEIKTPRVGTGFIEWAISGYDLEGRHADGMQSPIDYNRRGDWLYDKEIGPIDGDNANYRNKK